VKRVLALATCGAALLAMSIAACDSVPTRSNMGAYAVPRPLAAASAPAPVVVAEPVVPAPATPVLWGYVDGAGVAHFATTRLDSRYAQVLRETDDAHPVLNKKAGPEALLTWLEIAPEVKAMQPLLDEAARATGVDESLLKAVITVESGYDARAVSHAGAVGLMQLTPQTADRYGTKQERERPAAQRMLDARTNVLTGARMLADLTRRYGGIDIALAAWNAGEGAVRKAGGHMPDIAETEAHVHMVLELYWALMQRKLPQGVHGFTLDSGVRS